MKYNFLITLFAGAVLLSSCKKENLAVDVDPLDVPLKSQIAFYGPLGGSADAKNFFVGNTPAETIFKVPVAITKPSSTPTTIQISYPTVTGVTTAVQGTHFTAPTSITIPAGKVVDSITITGISSSLAAGSKLLLLKITGGDVGTVYQKDSVFVKLQQYCTPTLAAMSGNYTNSNEYTAAGAFSYGPYTTAITNLAMVPGSTTKATGKLVNIYDDGWVDLNIEIEWTGNVNKITIPLQTTGKSYAGGVPTHVRTSTTTGAVHTFSACDRSVSFSIDLVNSATGAALTSNYKLILK